MMRNENKKYRYPMYILWFVITVFLAFFLLLIVAFLPQRQISENLYESAEQLMSEGNYIATADKSCGAILDNYTDALILMTSSATQFHSLSFTLTNPVYSYGDGGAVVDLLEYATDQMPIPSWYYSRYWMGFRTLVRPLLTVLNYNEIRQLLTVVFFALFAVIVSSVTKRVSMKAAMVFAISVILVKPNVICSSLQFCCCFFIAFAAMLAMPWLEKRSQWDYLVFMEIGMLTMYFDFYTVPIITFAFPMVYLYMLRSKRGEIIKLKAIVSSTMFWFGGYGGMWVAKMLLTDILTEVECTKSAVGALLKWTGLKESSGLNYWESLQLLYKNVVDTVFPCAAWKVCAAMGVGVVVILLIYRAAKGYIPMNRVKCYLPILVVAILPIIWFVAAARPMVNHFYFQYRSIAGVMWSLGGYVCILWDSTPKTQLQQIYE